MLLVADIVQLKCKYEDEFPALFIGFTKLCNHFKRDVQTLIPNQTWGQKGAHKARDCMLTGIREGAVYVASGMFGFVLIP